MLYLIASTMLEQAMKNTLKKMIMDFHTRTLPKVSARDTDLPSLPSSARKAQICIGMRRSGKTYCLYQHMHQQLALGTPITQLCYLNFEDDRLLGFTLKNFQDLMGAYFDLYPDHFESKSITFYFDEIQNIENWERFIRRLLDTTQVQICITGSSAKMLSSEIATSLRGRCLVTEVFPLSYREYLWSRSIENTQNLSSSQISNLRHHAEKFLLEGGFPELMHLPQHLHEQTLQEYVNTAIYRDVIERYKLRNIRLARRFMKHCLQNISAPLSLRKLYQSFHSSGLQLSRNTLYELLEYFSDAYLLFPIQRYHYSLRKKQSSPQKLYTIDQGLIKAFSIKTSTGLGTELENAVFIHLRRQGLQLFYYLTEQDKEIDFLSLAENRKLSLYQVSTDISNEETKKREISAIEQATEELSLSEATIITLDEADTLHLDSGVTVHIKPYWDWARSEG